jgi:hypothetical protein
MTKTGGSGSESGSISQRHGSADPDHIKTSATLILGEVHLCITFSDCSGSKIIIRGPKFAHNPDL